MQNRFPVGEWGILQREVTPEVTAGAIGNPGVDVLATPMLVAFAEIASVQIVNPHLALDEATVGTHIEMNHLAATPVGMTVTVKSQLALFEGRKFVFKFEAFDDVEKVAEGLQERYLVNLPRLLQRAREKKPKK